MALTSFGPYPRTRVPGSTTPSWCPGERASRMRELDRLDELKRRKHPKRGKRTVRVSALTPSLADAYRAVVCGTHRSTTRRVLHNGQWC